MQSNPVTIILILLLLGGSRGRYDGPAGGLFGNTYGPPVIDTLEASALLDNLQSILRTIDKVNNITTMASQVPSLPDMKKILELAGPVISAMSSSSGSDETDSGDSH